VQQFAFQFLACIIASHVVVAASSSDICVLNVSSQVLSDQQEFEKADNYFQKAIEVDPENATVYVHRGK
jgi:Tfp pilus assembly protein PilF